MSRPYDFVVVGGGSSGWVLSDECEPVSVTPTQLARQAARRPRQVVSDECELVSGRPAARESGRAELTPFGERGRAALLENGPAVEVAILVEVVEDGEMNRGKGLQTSHAAKSLHRPLSSSQRLV